MAANLNLTRNVTHNSAAYQAARRNLQSGYYNGAYYYSQEIVRNIIPNVKTDRPWVTINVPPHGCRDHAIVFIHSNVNIAANYRWLKRFKDLVLVCSNRETLKACRAYGKVLYLPLSVDVEYVKRFRTEKTKDACYVGNVWQFKEKYLRKYVPAGVPRLTKMPRHKLLTEMAKYSHVYAIGRCAIEAKILGCEVEVCDDRYPNPSVWEILDNKEAAKMLQEELDKIDGGNNDKEV